MRRTVLRTIVAVAVSPAIGASIFALSFGVISIAQVGLELPGSSAAEVLEEVLSFLAFITLFVLIICYIIALPIALLLSVVLQRLKLVRWWHYGLAGAVVALAISSGVLFLLGGPFLALQSMLVFGVAGATAGLGAACSFWWIAISVEARIDL